MKPIINSLLETDLYKLTMWQAMLHHAPAAQAQYRFVCRNEPQFPLAELAAAVDEQLDHLCSLTFQPEELAYVAGLRFMKSDFIDWLHLFRFQRRFIRVSTAGPNLLIDAAGPIVHTTGFEIPVLSIVNELYFRELAARTGQDPTAEGIARLDAKIERLRALPEETQRRHPFEFFDFGLRRRYSGQWQAEVAKRLKAAVPAYFKGTSNVKIALDLGLTPIGTMAHEWLQLFQGMGNVRLSRFQSQALETWVQEYRGDLGTALTDVVGVDAFLRDFDLYHAKLFDGVRHDSGDPVEWGEKIIRHYQKLRVDASTKRLVFSDGLKLETAIQLWHHFGDRMLTGFGIGTSLMNDLGPKPLNIVMKLVRCNGSPVAKLSDSPGKTLCDDATFVRYLSDVFKQPLSA